MNRVTPCLIVSLCVLVGTMTSCSTSGTGSRADVHSDAESVAQVLAASSKKHDQVDVKVAGYFDAHFEGSSLRHDKNGEGPSMLIPFHYGPVVKDGWWTVDRSKWRFWRNKPVVIEGTFSIGQMSHMGHTIRDVPFLIPKRIVTVEPAELTRIIERDVAERAN